MESYLPFNIDQRLIVPAGQMYWARFPWPEMMWERLHFPVEVCLNCSRSGTGLSFRTALCVRTGLCYVMECFTILRGTWASTLQCSVVWWYLIVLGASMRLGFSYAAGLREGPRDLFWSLFCFLRCVQKPGSCRSRRERVTKGKKVCEMKETVTGRVGRLGGKTWDQ